MNADGTFELDQDQQRTLSEMWGSPRERATLEAIRNGMERLLMGRLRHCPKEDFDTLRAKLDCLDEFFRHFTKTAEKEVET